MWSAMLVFLDTAVYQCMSLMEVGYEYNLHKCLECFEWNNAEKLWH